MLQTGDILFAKGTSLVSKIIRKATKGEATHVGILYDEDTIFETDGSWGQAKFQPLSRYNGKDIEIYRYKSLYPGDFDEIRMLCYAYEGTPYSYWDVIVKLGLCWLPSKLREKLTAALGNRSFMICNELVMRIMLEVTEDKLFLKTEGSNPAKLRKAIREVPHLIPRII